MTERLPFLIDYRRSPKEARSVLDHAPPRHMLTVFVSDGKAYQVYQPFCLLDGVADNPDLLHLLVDDFCPGSAVLFAQINKLHFEGVSAEESCTVRLLLWPEAASLVWMIWSLPFYGLSRLAALAADSHLQLQEVANDALIEASGLPYPVYGQHVYHVRPACTHPAYAKTGQEREPYVEADFYTAAKLLSIE